MFYEPTLSETLNDLKAKGYTYDFNLNKTCLECQGGEIKLYPDEFLVDQVFRFEGDTDPGDAAILYAISAPERKIKGTLVDGYGVYASDASAEMINKLKI